MKRLGIGIAGAVLLAGASTIPSIPTNLPAPFVSYQYSDPNDVNIFGGVLPNGKVWAGTDPTQPHFTDDDGNGLISVSKYMGYRGNVVYRQIPDAIYSDKGKLNDAIAAHGIYANPLETELLSPADLLLPQAHAALSIASNPPAPLSKVAGTSITFSYSVTGNAPFLADLAFQDGSQNDDLTSITYATIALTRQNTQNSVVGGNRAWGYYLKAPATGPNNMVLTAGVSHVYYQFVSSYSGVDQTSPIDSSATLADTSTGPSATITYTTVADNSWQVSLFLDQDALMNVSTNCALSVGGDGSAAAWGQLSCDGGPKTPAGSFAVTVTANDGSDRFTGLGFTFKPAGPGNAQIIQTGGAMIITGGSVQLVGR